MLISDFGRILFTKKRKVDEIQNIGFGIHPYTS